MKTTSEYDLVPGAFYWIMPADDPDTVSEWEHYVQPARFVGVDSGGNLVWNWLAVDDSSTWPVRWIGPRIISPFGDENRRMACGNP